VAQFTNRLCEEVAEPLRQAPAPAVAAILARRQCRRASSEGGISIWSIRRRAAPAAANAVTVAE
jgi:hypothetical protein